MLICANCSAENPDHARFCSACGTGLRAEVAGESRRLVTIVFCDLEDSTQLSVRVDAESLRKIITRYFEEMRSAVERHGGVVEKFIGDAVLAIFGVPQLHEDDGLRGVRAAVDMRDALDELNVELVRDWGVTLRSRIGVNSGEVVAAHPFGGQTFVTGESVNLASRLEGAAAAGTILLGEDTYRLVRDAVITEEIELRDLKGLGDVRAHRLVSLIPGAAGHARRLDSPLVDRERETALLRDTFERMLDGRQCQLVTILGAAGVGKSRLVNEFLLWAEERATSYRGRCLAYGEGITFWPILEVTTQAAGLTDADTLETARAKIAGLLSTESDDLVVGERVSQAIGIGGTPGVPEETFWAIRTFFEALAERRPLVLVFDDIQWAEPTFLELLDHVAVWSRDVSIMLLCLARPELLEADRSWGGGKLNAATLLLEPLTSKESDALVRNLLGAAELAALDRTRIVQAAGGNPLFVEEILGMWIDDDLLRQEGDRWIPTDDLTQVAIPPTISALLAARLDRLSPDERMLMARAAVVGKEFSVSALRALVPEEGDVAIEEGLAALVHKELLRAVRPHDPDGGQYSYRHLLIRDAAYESLPKYVRADLHERFSGWLASQVGNRIEEYEEILGYHLEQAHRYLAELGPADDRSRALASSAGAHLFSAGKRAFARGDMPATANLLGRAVELLPSEHPSISILLPDLAESLMQTGRSHAAAKAWERLLLIAEARGDGGLAVMAELESSYVRFLSDPRRTDIDEFRKVADQAVRVHHDLADAGRLATSLVYLALTYWFAGDIDAMLDVSEQAMELAAGTDDVRSLLWAASSVGTALLLGPTTCERGLERVRRLMEDFPEPRTLQANAQLDLARLLGMVGRFDEAMEHAHQARTVLEDLGQGGWLAEAALTIGNIARWRGDLEVAELETRMGHRLFHDRGDLGNAILGARDLARTLLVRRQPEEARSLADEILSETGAYDREPQIEGRSILARVRAHEGEFVDAERLAREALTMVESTKFLNLHAEVLSDFAEILVAAGRRDAARGAAEDSLRRFQQKGNLIGADRARSILERVNV